jgi:hypothetical protein
MKLWPAAADGGRSANRDWRALRRLLLLQDRSFTHALDAVRAAERALRQDPLGDPAAIARWNEASTKHAMARQRLADAVRASVPAIVAFVRKLDDPQRRALASPVRAYARELLGRRPFENWSAVPFEVRRARAYALRVAGAGCFTGAEATAAWLARRDLQGWSFQLDPEEQTAAVLEVLRDRDPRWLAELARRLAGRMRAGDRQASGMLWATTAALVRHAGIDPPTTDGFVYAWALAHTASWPARRGDRDDRCLLDRLRDDPFLDALGPHLFEIDEAGELLLWGTRSSHRLPAEQTWPGALARLAAEGRLARAALLDRCLGRLLCGGRPATLSGFVALHDALAPDLDDLATRTRDYLRLLPDAQPAVAELAQRALRRLDDADRLDRSVVVDASRAVLFRTERKLLRAQLAWLDAAARRRRGEPGALDELLGATAVALRQDAAHLQERALSLLRRHARHASPAGRAALLHATEALADDVRRRLAEALGAAPPTGRAVAAGEPEATRAARPASRPSLSPPGPRALPPPIGTPAELAEELTVLLHAGQVDWEIDETLDPVALERVLAALVALAHADRVALHEAIAPVLLRYNISPPGDIPRRTSWEGWSAWLRSDDHWYWHGTRTAVGLVAAAATMTPAAAATGRAAPAREAWLRLVMSVPKAGRHPRRSRPRQAIVYRLREIATGLLYEPVPTLLATPTTATGHVDPTVLADKLARAEREGWQPWELDLQQALLRLPRERDPAVLDRARRLRSPAGQRLVAWLEGGGPPDPVLDRLVRVCPKTSPSWGPVADIDRTIVLAAKAASTPAARADDEGAARPSSAGWPPSLVELLFDLDPPDHVMPGRWWSTGGYDHAAKLCWPALLPSHRDVAAAHLLPALALLPRHSRGAGAVLPLLAEGDGPVGTAFTLALAHGLGASDRADRAAAADALVVVAGRGQLHGVALGRELAGLVTLGLFPVQRLVEPLRDVTMAGASSEVWTLLAAALPRLLPPAVERAPQRLAGLLSLAAEAATLARARGPLPAIAAVAARGGSSQLAAESRRLHDILTTA